MNIYNDDDGVDHDDDDDDDDDVDHDDDDDDDDNDDNAANDKNLIYIGRFFSLPNGYTIGCNRNGSDNVTHSDM